MSPTTEKYTDHTGKTWRFNQPVYGWSSPLPMAEKAGRLVQVRKGCGQFGSDVHFIRRKDGSLVRSENDLLREYEGELNDILDLPNQEYTIKHEWPETGFVIEKPTQPKSKSPSFTMAITSDTVTITL